MKKVIVFLSLLVGFLLNPPAALPGVMVVEAVTPLQGGGKTQTSKIYVDSDRIRSESWSGDQQQIFIYRADQGVIWMIDTPNETYREMTKQDLERTMSQVSDQMAQMKKMMEERMKDMSPEQRKMVEQMMKGRM